MCSHHIKGRPAWVFTVPRHIKCAICGAVGRRNASKQERKEFNRGGWFYLSR